LHLLVYFLTGKASPQWYPAFHCEQDFSTVLLKFATASLAPSHLVGLNVERAPIRIVSPFDRDVNSLDDITKKRRGGKRIQGVLRIWLYVFAVLSCWCIVFVGLFVRKREGIVLDPVEEDEEEEQEDFDYLPGGEHVLDDNESILSVDESDMSDADSLDHEIFDLAKDIQLNEDDSSPILQRSMDFFQNIAEPGIVTRSQRRLVFQPAVLNEPTNSSRRVCVCCQSEVRSIVLFPCGCLCLCDECRGMMSVRKYLNCPCCRRLIEGFSRFYEVSFSFSNFQP
jgi:hypothetical protein